MFYWYKHLYAALTLFTQGDVAGETLSLLTKMCSQNVGLAGCLARKKLFMESRFSLLQSYLFTRNVQSPVSLNTIGIQ